MLCGFVLNMLYPRRNPNGTGLRWLDPPQAPRLQAGRDLLASLGAVTDDTGHVTAHGECLPCANQAAGTHVLTWVRVVNTQPCWVTLCKRTHYSDGDGLTRKLTCLDGFEMGRQGGMIVLQASAWRS